MRRSTIKHLFINTVTLEHLNISTIEYMNITTMEHINNGTQVSQLDQLSMH